MRILGIDPGIARTGWGVIESSGNRVKPLAYDCFETSAKIPTPQRLEQIFEHLTSLIQTYQPESLAIEELFFNNNAKTAFVVGQARGVILLTGSQHSVPTHIYTPLQVKMAISGYGRADKSQIGHMVKVLLSLPAIPKPDDTADALAIALTHAFSNKINALELRQTKPARTGYNKR